MGRSASETCFGITVACHPRSPLDIPIVEDDEGRLGVGGQDGLEGVALRKGKGEMTPPGTGRAGNDGI